MQKKTMIIGAAAGVAAAAAGIAAVARRRAADGGVGASAEGGASTSEAAEREGGGGNDRVIYHVRPREEGWAVLGDGAEQATSRHRTKREALDAARALVTRKAPSRLVIHRMDGSVQDVHSYDPA